MSDKRINKIIAVAKNIFPDLFNSPTNSINSAKGRHGESGYSNFLNKGTGYAYCLYAKNNKYFISIWVSEAARNNKIKKQHAAVFIEKFIRIFHIENNKHVHSKTEFHHIETNRESYVKEVDVSDMDNMQIVEYMALLARK